MYRISILKPVQAAWCNNLPIIHWGSLGTQALTARSAGQGMFSALLLLLWLNGVQTLPWYWNSEDSSRPQKDPTILDKALFVNVETGKM